MDEDDDTRESLALRNALAEAGSRQMFEDVFALLHTQDQAAAPTGQELAHVMSMSCFESRMLSGDLGTTSVESWSVRGFLVCFVAVMCPLLSVQWSCS